jgi:Zn-dependent peptidase ImmA (M78 family)/transcriptional regulator with XRE-family HTH domain
MTQLIGARIKALREKRGLSQEALARQLGFKDRQTLSAIETGERRVSAEELILAVRELAEPLEYFTDPYILAGEASFSWRQTGVGPERLAAYENIAGRWIAAFRNIGRQIGRPSPLLRRTLGLTRQQRFEDATTAGERFAADFDLGQIPAAALRTAMERELGILVLMVDTNIAGISGAACRLPELDAVLINRHEVPGRQHFDLAHELFHVLTWDAMPPEHSEEAVEVSTNRAEQLANSFASALLMPSSALGRFGDWGGLVAHDLAAKLNAVADELQVTSTALKWRLVSAGRLAKGEAQAIRDAALRNNGRARMDALPPALFSRNFAEVIAKGLDEGQLSVRRAAALLDVRVDELPDWLGQHGLELSSEL